MAMIWNPKYRITNKLIFTIREIGEAVGEIRAYKIASNTLANLEIDARELSTFASTSIEGNPLALTDVKRILKQKPEYIRNTEREVLNYNSALQMIYQSVRSKIFALSIAEIQNIQGIVTEDLMDNPADCGAVRKAPVIIRNPRVVDEIIFIPPDYKDVPKLLEHLITFVNTNIGKIDPIILAGIFHRQHVIIHPFIDGNGRTTRLLTTAILGQSGLDLFEIFSFENYYNQNITRYFKAVGLIGDYYDLQDNIDFTEWLEYFADGILDELRRIRKTVLQSQKSMMRLEKHHQDILDYIDEHGSITQREYGVFSSRSLAARKNDFEKLVGLGLIQIKGIGRGTYYVREA